MTEQVRGLVGHVVDIDGEGRLRSREEHAVLWSEQDGRIIDVLGHSEALKLHPDATLQRIPKSAMILPGLIDCHIHYPQTRMVGTSALELFAWLKGHIWPEEALLREPQFAEEVARAFLRQMLRQGTTSAFVFGSQFAHANSHLFDLALQLGMSLCLGETLQDTDSPEGLLQEEHVLWKSVEDQIAQWHNRDRLRYVVSPRFVPSCSRKMLDRCGQLLAAQPDLFLQSHVNETRMEVERTMVGVTDASHPVGIFERYGLLTPRTILAHSVYSTDDELRCLADHGAVIAHCPSSNAFLGSGHFPYRRHLEAGVRVGLATDVAAGVSFSMWREAGFAFLTQMHFDGEERLPLDGESLLRAMTRDGARAMGMEGEMGCLEASAWADIVVLEPRSHTYLGELNNDPSASLEQRLFRAMTVAEDEMVAATYVAGNLAFQRDPAPRWPWIEEV
ncbi:MAG: guanine deaminase [Myxococcales bacterium]|nr:guanine deaminase [Myxococcales bacterium]MCB9644354.1 guanine deaminase [Myxococcales bacterium]